jgi:hypothetical protein
MDIAQTVIVNVVLCRIAIALVTIRIIIVAVVIIVLMLMEDIITSIIIPHMDIAAFCKTSGF